jgi:hypothetical protein
MGDWQCVTLIFVAFLFGYILASIFFLPRD